MSEEKENDADVWFNNMCESDCAEIDAGGEPKNLEFRMSALFYLRDIRNYLFKLLKLRDDKK